MPGLLDIAVQTAEVQGVTVYGGSARGIAYLFGRFPEIRMLMSEMQVSVDRIIGMAPEAVAAIIAVGCGYVPGGHDADGKPITAEMQIAAEEKAASLPVGVQVEFLEPILRITMPGGVGPFVASLEKLSAYASDAFGPEVGTKLAPPSQNAPSGG
jgi:hypothetical protein